MGTVMAVTALSNPQLPDWVAALVMFGGVVNPLTFVPMVFSTTMETTKAFQWVSFVSFVSLSLGLNAQLHDLDLAGNYSRPDIFELSIDRRVRTGITISDK